MLNVDMIFNFPTQTEEILRQDIRKIQECGCGQTTFSPLYVSSATTRKMADALGKMDYDREYRYYQLLDDALVGGDDAQFERRTIWTFNRKDEAVPSKLQVDEYSVSYEEYPAIGSGAISHLGGCLYVNNFSLADYDKAISSGKMSLMGKVAVGKTDLMRYHFLLELYSLRLDKREFRRRFGCTVDAGLRMEMAFLRANGAFAIDDDEQLTLTPKGRYLTSVMHRQFLSGLNELRDQARAAIDGPERQLLFGEGVPA